MRLFRRRFFGLAAAAPAVAAVPALAKAPVVEMVAADIAPVAPAWPHHVVMSEIFTDLDVSISEYTTSILRPQMLALSRAIDRDLMKALGHG